MSIEVRRHENGRGAWSSRHEHVFGEDRPTAGERRTIIVVVVTAITMLVEIRRGGSASSSSRWLPASMRWLSGSALPCCRSAPGIRPQSSAWLQRG